MFIDTTNWRHLEDGDVPLPNVAVIRAMQGFNIAVQIWIKVELILMLSLPHLLQPSYLRKIYLQFIWKDSYIKLLEAFEVKLLMKK